MAVMDGIYKVRNLIESGEVEVSAKRMGNGHVLVSFTGATYPVKDVLKSRFYATWDRASQCWNIEVEGFYKFWKNGQWVMDSGHAEEMEEAIGADIWYEGMKEE